MPQDPFAQYAVAPAPAADPFAQFAVQPAPRTSRADASRARVLPPTGPAPSQPQATAFIGTDQLLGRGRSGTQRVIGAAKGAANSVIGLGELAHRLPGVSTAVDALYGRPGISDASFDVARQEIQPTNADQRIGFSGEQLGEFFLPIGAVGKVGALARVGQAAVTTGAQTGSGEAAGAAAALSAVVPGAGAVRGAARFIDDRAQALVRSAIKPTVTAMKQVAGASVTGIDAQASRLVTFILDNKVATAEKARTIISEAEKELQRVLSLKNAPTDAPQRAVRYLDALERSAAKQLGTGRAADVATIRNAAAEVLESSLGKDVVTMIPKPHPTLLGPNGKPLTVMVPQTTRALRTDVMADEALEGARATSKWDTRRQWGELKGSSQEASKAIERAARDATKAAVPEAAPILRRQGMAIQAAKALDRGEFRAANRDAVSLPAHVIAAGEVAKGQVPFLAMAANWLRDNQMQAGMWARPLANAIAKGNAPMVADILKKISAGGASQAMQPVPVP